MGWGHRLNIDMERRKLRDHQCSSLHFPGVMRRIPQVYHILLSLDVVSLKSQNNRVK